MVKHLPTMKKTWVQSLDWEDLLEKTHGNPLQYSCLRSPMDKGAWQAIQSMGSQRVRHNLAAKEQKLRHTYTHTHLHM